MSSGQSKWPVWIAWALPYKAMTLSVQAYLPQVLGNLQALAIAGIRHGEQNSLDGYEYKVRSLPQGIRILGPFGNRRWLLVAYVTVLPNVLQESPVTLAIATHLEKRPLLNGAMKWAGEPRFSSPFHSSIQQHRKTHVAASGLWIPCVCRAMYRDISGS